MNKEKIYETTIYVSLAVLGLISIIVLTLLFGDYPCLGMAFGIAGTIFGIIGCTYAIQDVKHKDFQYDKSAMLFDAMFSFVWFYTVGVIFLMAIIAIWSIKIILCIAGIFTLAFALIIFLLERYH